MDLLHPLKLHADPRDESPGPVVSETYDEFVISEPTWVVWEKYNAQQPFTKPAPKSTSQPYFMYHR